MLPWQTGPNRTCVNRYCGLSGLEYRFQATTTPTREPWTFARTIPHSPQWRRVRPSPQPAPFDYHNPRLNYAPSDLDNTHVLNGYFVYDLPFGHGRTFGSNWNRVVDGLVGGWRLSGDGYLQSGRPITFFSGFNTFSGSVQTPASCSGACNARMGDIHVESSGQTYYFTAAQRAQFSVPDTGGFSNLGRNFFRQDHVWQADTTVSKSFRSFREQYLEFRLEAQNVFKVITYDTFGSQSIQSTSFTRLNPATDGVLNNSPRKVQLSAKYVF